MAVRRKAEGAGRKVCASLLYRALLDSILRRGQTRTYDHGVGYLRKPDSLAMSVSDWRGMEPHAAYKDGIRQHHPKEQLLVSLLEGTPKTSPIIGWPTIGKKIPAAVLYGFRAVGPSAMMA